MEEVTFNPVTGEQFEGFNWRKSLKRAVNSLPGKRYGAPLVDNVFRRGNRVANRFGVHFYEGDESFDGEYENFSLKKVFKRKEGGTFFGNMLRGVAQNAKGMIPLGLGNLLPIGDGLMMKKADIQAAPAEAVQVAQTPQQAQAVVQAIAPNLTGMALRTAVSAVQQSNSPEDAMRTASSVAALGNVATKETEKKKTAYIIGGSLFGFGLIALIIWLIVRK